MRSKSMANNDYEDYDGLTMPSYSRHSMASPVLPSILPALPILLSTNHPFSLTPALDLPPRINSPLKRYWQPQHKEAQG